MSLRRSTHTPTRVGWSSSRRSAWCASVLRRFSDHLKSFQRYCGQLTIATGNQEDTLTAQAHRPASSVSPHMPP